MEPPLSHNDKILVDVLSGVRILFWEKEQIDENRKDFFLKFITLQIKYLQIVLTI